MNPHFFDKVFLLSVQALQKGTQGSGPCPLAKGGERRNLQCSPNFLFSLNLVVGFYLSVVSLIGC